VLDLVQQLDEFGFNSVGAVLEDPDSGALDTDVFSHPVEHAGAWFCPLVFDTLTLTV